MTILTTIKAHKLDITYASSAGITLADPVEKVELITSLKEIPVFDTVLSVAVLVEIGAAIGVCCMLIHYAYKGYKFISEWRKK